MKTNNINYLGVPGSPFDGNSDSLREIASFLFNEETVELSHVNKFTNNSLKEQKSNAIKFLSLKDLMGLKAISPAEVLELNEKDYSTIHLLKSIITFEINNYNTLKNKNVTKENVKNHSKAKFDKLSKNLFKLDINIISLIKNLEPMILKGEISLVEFLVLDKKDKLMIEAMSAKVPELLNGTMVFEDFDFGTPSKFTTFIAEGKETNPKANNDIKLSNLPSFFCFNKKESPSTNQQEKTEKPEEDINYSSNFSK